MRKTIDPALLDLRDLHRFSDHDIMRVQNAEAIHRAMMNKNFGNETFQIMVIGVSGEVLGLVKSDSGVTRFFIKGK